MKSFTSLFIVILISVFYTIPLNAQNQAYKITGNNFQTIHLNESFTTTQEIYPFSKGMKIYGLSVKANVQFYSDNSLVRFILVDESYQEHLVYETYPLLQNGSSIEIDNLCEETGVLEGLIPRSLRMEIKDAAVQLAGLTLSTKAEPGFRADLVKKENKKAQNEDKINKINKSLKERGMHWVAGATQVSGLSWEEKKALFGESKFPAGFEYYAGGVISTGMSLKSVNESMMTSQWDWRNRHGRNWVTSIKDQKSCGSCWAFAAVGATESLVNLYYNQLLQPDLSEQDVVSCSLAGTCSGGNPGKALDYITTSGVVDEQAFPYVSANGDCLSKSTNPAQRFKFVAVLTLVPPNIPEQMMT